MEFRESSDMIKSGSLTQFDWYLEDEDGKPVCTFVPKVLGIIENITNLGIISLVRLKLCFKEGEDKETLIPLSELDKVEWFEIDRRCVINHEYPKAKKYLGNLIRAKLHEVPTDVKYRLDRLGIHIINDQILFCAGDRVFSRSSGNDDRLNYELADIPFRLDIDPELTGREVFDGMKVLISLSPEIGRILVAYVISGFIRTAFKEAGCPPCFALVIVGESGLLKSHYIPHMVQLYNRSDEIRSDTRFNSTTRFIEDILSECSERTVIIDDLHSAETRSIKKVNEATAEEIIRRIGDDMGRGHKEGNAQVQKTIGGNVIFIGEYMIGKDSTIPRSVVVYITKRPDGKIFDEYQRKKPLLVSTFYCFFIQWYVDHFHDICNEIGARLTAFREKSADSEIHRRLLNAQFCLKTSYMIFLAFCRESGFISLEDAKDEYHNFNARLANIILEQQARYKPEIESVDYLQLIRKLYRCHKIRVASSDKMYHPDKHDGLIHYECLCLRRERLERLLREIYPNVNVNEVIEALTNMHALKHDSHTARFIIKISSKNKHVKGKCFYGIWLHMLK